MQFKKRENEWIEGKIELGEGREDKKLREERIF